MCATVCAWKIDIFHRRWRTRGDKGPSGKDQKPSGGVQASAASAGNKLFEDACSKSDLSSLISDSGEFAKSPMKYLHWNQIPNVLPDR